MDFIFRITAFLIIASIFGFEFSHIDAHAHELDHKSSTLKIEVQDNQSVSAMDSEEHKHANHDHLILLSRIEKTNYDLEVFPSNSNLSGHLYLESKIDLIMTSRRILYQSMKFAMNHAFLYKNPFQFRNRPLLV